VDPAFHLPGQVSVFALQSDGKILVGGEFGTGANLKRVARLNPDGSLESGFGTLGPSSVNAIGHMLPLAGGRTLVGGEFGEFSGKARIRLARLEPNGTLDTAWTAGSVLERSSIGALAVQPDGGILVGISTSGGSSATDGLLRLKPDGAQDANFLAAGAVNGSVSSIQVLTNGDFYIGGRFTSVAGSPRSGVARLKADGSLDPSFDPGAGAKGEVNSLVVQSDGRLLVAGEFTNFAGVDRVGLARLQADGSLDLSFNAGTAGGIKAMAVQADGSIVLAGFFYYIQEVRRVGVARLLADGRLDLDFAAGEGYFRQVAIQPDGKILVGGGSSPGLFRLLSQASGFPGRFELLPQTITATEGTGPVELTIRRLGGSYGLASVSYTASRYAQVVVSNAVSFADGQTEAAISIPVTDDAEVQVGTSIYVVLHSPSIGAEVGYYHNCDILVLDNDTGFAIEAYPSAYENDGVVSAIVTRQGADFSPMQVEYATVDGTAKAGKDYVAQSGTLYFGEGETSQVIVVALLDNPEVQWMHTFNLLLRNPTAGAVLINGGQAQIMLMDVVSEIAFDGYGNYSTNEAAAMALVPVRRGGRTSNQVTVHYQTEGGTAEAGVDYQPASGTLTFAPGETLKRFAVPLLDNSQPQTNRTVQLRLLNPSSEALLDVAPDASLRTLLIVDDDHPGDVDFTFNPELGPGAWVSKLAATPSQQIIAAGSSLGLVRFNPDGSTDPGFQAAFSPIPNCLLPVNNGKLWTGGYADWLRILAEDGTAEWTSPGLSGVSVMALQPDQKVLVGVSSWTGSGLARLLPNGDYDPLFTAMEVRDMSVAALVVQPDGRILCGGSFPGTASKPGLVRLLADGTLDSPFAQQLASIETASGSPGAITALQLQPDGGILIGGRFDQVGGRTARNLARLKPDGSVDESWHAGAGLDGAPHQLVLQGDGAVLVCGSFRNVQGVPRPGLARLLPDGRLDTSFAPDLVDVGTMLLQGDGRIVVGGGFFTVNSLLRSGLVRLRGNPESAAGMVSLGDAVGTVLESAGAVNLQVRRTGGSRGRLVVPYAVSGGTAVAGTDIVPSSGAIEFADGDTQTKTISLRVLADGQATGDKSVQVSLSTPVGGAVLATPCTLDWTIQDVDCAIEFAAQAYRMRESTPSLRVQLVRQGNLRGTAAVGYETRAGSAKPGVHYVYQAGAVRFSEGQDTAEIAISLLQDKWGGPDTDFSVELLTPSPGVLIGTNGITRVFIADDDRPGTLQTPFTTNLPTWVSAPSLNRSLFSEVADLALDANRRVLALVRAIRNPFESPQPGPSSVVRYNPEGTIDYSFTPGGGSEDSTLPDDDATVLAPCPDGSVLVGTPTRLVRILPSGQAEPGAFGGVWGQIQTLLVFPDGSFLVGGALRPNLQDISCHLVRRKADGTDDPSFTPVVTAVGGVASNAVVQTVAQDTQGRLLVGGNFTSIQGNTRWGLARLNSRGELDPAFDAQILSPAPGEGTSPGIVHRIVLQADGRIILLGSIVRVNGIARPNLARLLPDGSLDASFDPILPFGWMQPDPYVGLEDMAVQSDGKIVLVGTVPFEDPWGWRPHAEGRIARLNADGTPDALFDAAGAVATLVSEHPFATIGRVAVDWDGTLLIGGRFNYLSGVPCAGVARINGGVALGFTRVRRIAANQLLLEAMTPLPTQLQLQSSTDLVSWTTIATKSVAAGPVQWEVPVPPGVDAQFFRLRARP
jgi:uncharacterized delta-60 repeat protein